MTFGSLAIGTSCASANCASITHTVTHHSSALDIFFESLFDETKNLFIRNLQLGAVNKEHLVATGIDLLFFP